MQFPRPPLRAAEANSTLHFKLRTIGATETCPRSFAGTALHLASVQNIDARCASSIRGDDASYCLGSREDLLNPGFV